jgi:hypothetical protein
MILEINTAHHYMFMCPLYNHVEALNIIIMNECLDFIFWLLHIHNLPTLFVLIPLCSPCTPFVDCENTFDDCVNLSIACAHNFDDYANTPNDWVNTTIDLVDTFDISSLDLCIPNFALLQLLSINRSKIKIVFTIGSMIYSLSLNIFHMWFWYFTSFIVFLCVRICFLNSIYTLFPPYWHMLFFCMNFRFHVFIRF